MSRGGSGKKIAPVLEDTLAFLRELSDPIEADDLPPVIRRKARGLAARLSAALQRGADSNLEPGDRGRIASLVKRKIAAGMSLHKAAECAAERFHLSARRIEQIYNEFSKRVI